MVLYIDLDTCCAFDPNYSEQCKSATVNQMWDFEFTDKKSYSDAIIPCDAGAIVNSSDAIIPCDTGIIVNSSAKRHRRA